MTWPAHIDMTAEHRHLVLHVLRAHLPAGTAAWAFGSRATGRARRYSDLDIAIDAGRRLNLEEKATLAEAFSDSDLPYRVDIIDWHAIDDRFRRLIAAERRPLVEAASSGQPMTAPPASNGK